MTRGICSFCGELLLESTVEQVMIGSHVCLECKSVNKPTKTVAAVITELSQQLQEAQQAILALSDLILATDNDSLGYERKRIEGLRKAVRQKAHMVSVGFDGCARGTIDR